MGKFLANWKKRSPADKVATGIVMGSCILVIILALLQLFGVWKDAGFAYLPFLCLNFLTLVVINWKTNRTVAILNLVAAMLTLASLAVSIYARLAA